MIIKIENLGLKMLPYVVLRITILTYWLDTKYFKLSVMSCGGTQMESEHYEGCSGQAWFI